MDDTEILVVGRARGAGAVESRLAVVARVPPWITVFRVSAEDVAGVAGVAEHLRELSGDGCLALARSPHGEITSMGDETVVRQIDEHALLFIEAWKSGPRKSPRQGEGRNWGDPEFRPPDQPNGV
ncbi:hypothetical protein [Streptomyces canus]|uniref:hypothetical protein n=1 Tax=Streptomyces canus TaxID=58343 RepID=UPI002E273EBF